ncbi:MAG: DNA repair ATPase [Gammaproteobacteria bacterium]|nr:MAG: DNA repair ATPase [Gammaproteobacteria bacterium]
MAKSRGDYQAILFVQDRKVVKQMRFTEFEAILDGMIAMAEWRDTDAHVVYVEMDTSLRPTALVFFTLYFDENGMADPEWNLPLRRFAQISASGPDLGAGPIRLACRSQCAIDWHRKDLWDPDVRPNSNLFHVITEALAKNRLGFDYQPPEDASAVLPAGDAPVEDNIPVLAPESIPTVQPIATVTPDEERKRLKLARLIKSQRLRIRTLETELESVRQEAARKLSIEGKRFRQKVLDLEQALARQTVLNEQLQKKLAKRNEQFLNLQEELSKQRKRINTLQDELQKTLSNEDARQMQERISAELTIVKEQLERKDRELYYRTEREEQLREEVRQLKEELASREGADKLQQLAELDVVLVVYHPGAGHITLPVQDVDRYIANPQGYAAEKCFVEEELYRAWLEHYEHPVCMHQNSDGSLCGESVTAISTPSDFVPGVNDRCAKHLSNA